MLDDLKKFEKVSYTAVIQCAGNGRSFFEPRVPGGQWKNGAMGNTTWGGARLRDVLNAAGVQGRVRGRIFNGLDADRSRRCRTSSRACLWTRRSRRTSWSPTR